MTSLRRTTAQLLLCLALCSFSFAAPLKKAGEAGPSAREKCPVCGMFVAKYPNWVASTRFKDGTVYYFDGPKDMFSHYLDAPRYTPGKRQADIAAMSVKDYYSLKTMDANSAYFVLGSDVYGPMGSELIPFASGPDAASFMADHKGKKVLRFKEIDQKVMKSLN